MNTGMELLKTLGVTGLNGTDGEITDAYVLPFGTVEKGYYLGLRFTLGDQTSEVLHLCDIYETDIDHNGRFTGTPEEYSCDIEAAIYLAKDEDWFEYA